MNQPIFTAQTLEENVEMKLSRDLALILAADLIRYYGLTPWEVQNELIDIDRPDETPASWLFELE